MKKIILLLVFTVGSAGRLFSQEREILGIVCDKDTKQRITKVHITNLRTNQGLYNNLKGEFVMQAAQGDKLVANLQGYQADTVTVSAQNSVFFFLKRTNIMLQEVQVNEKLLSPKSKLEQTKRDFKSIYRIGNSSDLLTTGGTNGLGGAGLSIDAIYSALSREGKNARYLQGVIARDYRETMIDFRFTASLVTKTTGLQGEQLADFMHQHRPSYYFVMEATDYELINYIKLSYQKYLRNPALYRLNPLRP